MAVGLFERQPVKLDLERMGVAGDDGRTSNPAGPRPGGRVVGVAVVVVVVVSVSSYDQLQVPVQPPVTPAADHPPFVATTCRRPWSAAPMDSTVTLRSGVSTAVVYPGKGGRLGQLDLGDGPLLRGPGLDLDWSSWGCFPLLPWSNRLPGGHLRFGEIDAHLPVNHDDGSAIHGLAADQPWNIDRSDDSTIDLTIRVHEGPYEVRGNLSYVLTPDLLRFTLGATNEGDQPVPVGLGFHPWFHRGEIRVPADARWPGEPLPTGPPVPVADRYDLRDGRVPEPMDVCFTALTGTVAEVPGAWIVWEGPITHVVVFSGEPGWVCVEPVTMANDGIAMANRGVDGHGVRTLRPGNTMEVSYEIERRPR